MNFEYNTISHESKGLYKERGSKFFSFAHHVESEDEIKILVKTYRKEFYDARHHCYAYVLGADKNRFRAADDGEPSNSAGAPILGQIRSMNLTNVFVIVVRYFGGTKLGVPGLINAYRSACVNALGNSKVVNRQVCRSIKVVFGYQSINEVMKVVKDFNLTINDTSFENDACIYNIEYRLKDEDDVFSKLNAYIKR